ncbi:MAG TPA: hypothetical protein VFS21_19385, partial [Roseiflexaceae bacterium]|nr:hypothetical protein [Roseiflexaceae bacterium]
LIEQIDLAVHPTAGWPAVLAVNFWNFGSDPAALFARVYDPQAGRWGPVVQLDTGASSLGGDQFHSAAIAVAPDGTVHAAWGASDADGALWASASSDHGASWSAPQRLATGCWHVRGLAATPQGGLLVLGICVQTTRDEHGSGPAIIERTPAGTWLPPQPLPVVAWDGDLVVTGDQAVALVTPRLGGDTRHTGFLLTRPLDQPGASWRLRTVPLLPPGLPPQILGDFAWHLQGTPTRDGAVFTWAAYDRAGAFALRVVGEQAEPAQAIIADNARTAETGRAIWHVAPVFDPGADRLAAIWGCCGNPLDNQPASLVGGWSQPWSGVWRAALQTTPADEGGPLPLDARRVGALASAQAPGSRVVWLGWVEDRQELRVQSLPVEQLVPPAELPTPVPEPTAEVAP